jgi:uncharacterized protein (TIGR00369 family)
MTLDNEILQQLTEAFAAIPFNRMLGLELKELGAEQVSMSFKMQEALVGNFLYGILHGGVISSVLDMAGGMVCMSNKVSKNSDKTLPEIANIVSKTSTIDLQISYLRPGKGEFFIAHAWLLKAGNKISFARMELLNQDKSLIATGNGTYLLK